MKIKVFYSYVVVILVYRNFLDLQTIIPNILLQINNVKIIIVNSFYDEESLNKIKNISKKFDCDFLNVKNKGYGYGNNKGINFSIAKYNFDFLIVSNPDIILRKFDNNLSDINQVYAPNIINLQGKKLNPMLVSKDKFAYFFEFYGYKYHIFPLIYFGILIHKIKRIFFLLFKKSKPIFAPHGCFIVFGRNVLNKRILFDENIFLYGEEVVLAYKLFYNNILVNYNSNIDVIHKENGSLSFSNFNKFLLLKKANMYIYNTYIKKNSKSNNFYGNN
jgi:GT2 family glycosyltransferase